MNQPLLQITNLRTYLQAGKQQIRAVDDISFTINRGETFCLVGESGSGKSMTALSIIRLLPAGITSHPSGTIIFHDQKGERGCGCVPHISNLLTVDAAAMRSIRGAKIAAIFQEPSTALNPVLTIGVQILESVQLHNPDMNAAIAQQQVLDALAQVQIDPKRYAAYPHQLSIGQQQRVMIAMALACQPELLIADEPTSALDVTVQAEILNLLRELQHRTHMSILLVTHDFGVVTQMAQQVGVMYQGKLVETGPTEQVLCHPQHPYTQRLLAALPDRLVKASAVAEGATATPAVINPQPLVQVRDLKVWFYSQYQGLFSRHRTDTGDVGDTPTPPKRAVDGVSLDIAPGEIVALVGESGCGKTTLGRAVLQLEQPTAGSVRLHGQELTMLSRRALRPLRRKMQIVFQDPQASLNPRLLIENVLTEPLQVHGIGINKDERIAMAAQALRSVQLEPQHLWHYPHEFSGGQRQRISLARALVLNPDFIVCDEVTSALDVSIQAEVLQLLLQIRSQRGIALLFITHNISAARYISDRIIVMKDGKIVEAGTTTMVCDNPQQQYTKTLLAAVPKLPDC